MILLISEFGAAEQRLVRSTQRSGPTAFSLVELEQIPAQAMANNK